MAFNIQSLTRLIRREKIDLVHARSRAPAWSALAAARRTGRPFVTTYHSKVHESPRLKVLYNSVMARGDAIIANSAYTARRIAKVHAPDADRLFTVPRGIDIAYFDPAAMSPARVAALRERWSLDVEERTLFMLPARLTRWKGQEVAIEAAFLLHAAGRADFLLLLVGDAQGREAYVRDLQGLIHDKQLGGIVRIMPPCDDMPAAYAISDIVLAPSIEPEPFGRIAVEAQAMAKPIIASDAGGQRETVVTTPDAEGLGATGMTVPSGEPAELAGAMSAMLELGKLEREAMGTRGRANVLAHFSVDAMASATLAIYARLLGASLRG